MCIIYLVKRIQSLDEIEQAELFSIDHYQWSGDYRPKAYGRMALLNDYGFVVKLTAIETNPLTRYTQDEDPVYRDSAMEAFFNFAPEKDALSYVNFEMNANGAMLGGFGVARVKDRKTVKNISSYQAECIAKKEDTSWSVLLKVPFSLIQDLFGKKHFSSGDVISCNFYKICEDASLEHYASYAPIISDTPNFHLPEYFAKVVIE